MVDLRYNTPNIMNLAPVANKFWRVLWGISNRRVGKRSIRGFQFVFGVKLNHNGIRYWNAIMVQDDEQIILPSTFLLVGLFI